MQTSHFVPHPQFSRRIIANALLVVGLTACAPGPPPTDSRNQPPIVTRTKSVLTVDELRFRDLNANGRLDPYEDWRLAPAQRAADLVIRMTLEEKAGLLMHGTAPSQATAGVTGSGIAYDLEKAQALIGERHVNSLITRLAGDSAQLATQNNALQSIAESARLGIPLTISSDPRNHFQYTAGASVAPGQFSQWPETLGFGALDDPALVRRFADIARREYRAAGIHMALSPQADLATEPRWPRVAGTFGERSDRVSALAGAYVEGFQGGRDGVAPDGVLTVVKHFAGYGAAQDGWDAHNYYGRFAIFPNQRFDDHVAAFRGAFDARAGGVMPTYSVFADLLVDGHPIEQVGGGYNRWLLTDVLREREGFDGLVLSDWAILNDCDEICRNGFPDGQAPGFAGLSTGFGVESLTKPQRIARGLLAGLDQFGGADETAAVVEAVREGLLPETRIDASALRVLLPKFRLGLFENPYVDPQHAVEVIGAPTFRAEGEAAQRRALVLLENRDGLLPLAPDAQRVFLHGISPQAARVAGFAVASSLAEAQFAVIRAAAPFQTPHPNYPFGAIQHEGDLDFKDDDATLAVIRRAAAQGIPVIVTVMLDRPAILTNVKPHVAALFGDFGISDAALFDVIAGRARPEGRLPFELPSSMQAVRGQAPDTPADSRDPLYAAGYGLRY